MKLLKYFLLFLFLLIIVLVFVNYPKLTIITGYSAKNTASSVFIAHRSLEFTETHDNHFSPVDLAGGEVDSIKKTSTASVFGLMKRKAYYREGLGSVLVLNEDDINTSYPVPKRMRKKINLPFPYGHLPAKDTVFANVDTVLLRDAVNQAFLNNSTQKTRSVLVLYKDHIIAEKYDSGYHKESLFLGWSMSKSILATLFGIMEFQGTLNIHDKADIKAWENDERRNITISNLLQMNSGLAWEEDYTSISDVTRMLFLSEDMSAVQAEKKALYPPGNFWNYSSGTSNLLSGILRDKFNTHQEYLNFPYENLIDRIGMHSMILEADLSGNYVGSSYCWATTRDWAKFGLLYLHKGNWNGDRLFNSSWVTYVTSPAAGSDGKYGGHFWLNTSAVMPDAPMDTYSANGYQGQRVYIIPSKNLVIVRTGLAEAPDFDFNHFVGSITNAIKD